MRQDLSAKLERVFQDDQKQLEFLRGLFYDEEIEALLWVHRHRYGDRMPDTFTQEDAEIFSRYLTTMADYRMNEVILEMIVAKKLKFIGFDENGMPEFDPTNDYEQWAAGADKLPVRLFRNFNRFMHKVLRS